MREYHDEVIARRIIIQSRLENEVIAEAAIDFTVAAVEEYVDFALNRVNALPWIVNVAPVIQAIHLEESGVQELRLGELAQYTVGLPVVIC